MLRSNKHWSQKLLKMLDAWTDHIPSEVKDDFVSICHWRLRDSILQLSPSLPVLAEEEAGCYKLLSMSKKQSITPQASI